MAPGPNNNNNIKVSSPASSEMAAGSVNSENDEGAYGNKRLLHACTSLIGTTVLVDTDDGHQYEGVFRVFSSKLEISLDQAHEVDPKDPSRINPEKVEKTMVFPMSAIGKITNSTVKIRCERRFRELQSILLIKGVEFCANYFEHQGLHQAIFLM